MAIHTPITPRFYTMANSAICAATLSELTDDGLHPNDAGHEILATEIGEYLLNL